MTDWISFLFFTLLAIAIQGLFALFEMAAVSFNPVRLQYYVSLGEKRALWLHFLLKRPSRLFGTALIGINTALQAGSECSRRFYESLHLNPDWAPLSQVLAVVIFAELVPMFAARRHPEQVAIALVPLMVLLALFLQPLIWVFDALSRAIHKLFGKTKETASLFLSREEIKTAFEEREEGEDEFNALIRQIFQLKNQTVGQIMTPLEKVIMAPSTATFGDIRQLLKSHFEPIVPIYHLYPHNLVAIAHVRDLLSLEEKKKVLEKTRSPWFVMRDTSVLQVLEQFRRNNQSVAVILDLNGQACGVLTLDQIVAEIFGEEAASPISPPEAALYIERTLSGDMTVEEFNRQFTANLPHKSEDTLSDFLAKELNHPPEKGEEIRVGSFAFTVLEPTLRGVKLLSVQTLQE